MEYTSSIGFTVGTLTDCHVEVKSAANINSYLRQQRTIQ